MFYLGTLLRAIAQRISLSDSSEGLFQRGKGWDRIHRHFCWKKEHIVEHQKVTANLHTKKPRHFKLMILLLFYIWEDARVWAHWNYYFDLHLNYLGPVSCSLHPELPSGHTIVGCWWQVTLVVYQNGRQHSSSAVSNHYTAPTNPSPTLMDTVKSFLFFEIFGLYRQSPSQASTEASPLCLPKSSRWMWGYTVEAWCGKTGFHSTQLAVSTLRILKLTQGLSGKVYLGLW